MRILMLTQWFDPEHTMKGLMFARALTREGHDVEVITGFPNYPGGKVYPGYRIKLFQREQIDGVRILRVALYPSHDASAVGRVLNYVSFAASASFLGTLLTRRPDVIYVYHPPLTAGLAAIAVGALKRAPFVYDVQDLWPDTLGATGMVGNARVLRAVDRLARWVYQRAAFVVAQSPGFRQALASRGVPESKLDVIYNWCDEDQLHLEHNPGIAKDLAAGERFNVVFAGTMGKAQGLESVLRAAQLLAERGSGAQFVFVGGGVELASLKARAERSGLTNVRFLPRMPMAEIGQVLEAADVLLVHLRDDPLFEITIPGKLQAYMAVGKPVLVAVRGDAADLIEASRGGATCEPEDAVGLADAVGKLEAMEPDALKEMGDRGKRYYESELSIRSGVPHFIRIFETVVARGRS
jgi:glycosyltransferase involved in cell wall biosynthesis